MQRKFNKIFQIGFHRCGTTSIHNLFINAGLKSIHWDNGRPGKIILENIINDKMPLTNIEDYDCYTDIEYQNNFPLIDHYKLLDEKYPNSLFILNTRPLTKWIKSRLNHHNGLFWIEYQKDKKLQGIYLVSKKDVVHHWKKEWEKHHKEAIQYFKNKENFLFFDIEKEPEKIIAFLKKWGIKADYLPHSHKTQKGRE
jgi:hypothetical protein